MANDRIPQGVRKEINRVGPGRYCDPTNGRIYVDSTDMDGSFEEMIDGVKVADEKRDAEKRKEARADAPRPPVEIEELAVARCFEHADRLGGGIDVKMATNRRTSLLGRQTWKRSLGGELDRQDLDELEALNQALGKDDDGTRTPEEPDAAGRGDGEVRDDDGPEGGEGGP